MEPETGLAFPLTDETASASPSATLRGQKPSWRHTQAHVGPRTVFYFMQKPVSVQGTSCSNITLVAQGGREPEGAGRPAAEARKPNELGYTRSHLLQSLSPRAATPSLNQHGTNDATRGWGGARSSEPAAITACW